MAVYSPKQLLLAAAVSAGLGGALAAPLALQPRAAVAEAAATVELPSFRQLIKDNVGAVVSIRGQRSARPTADRGQPQLPEGLPESFRRFFEQMPQGPGPGFPMQSQGSGFIISEDGYVLTNAHVVDSSSEVYVRLNDNRELKAEVIGSDKRSDVALLKVEAGDLPTVRLGDSRNLEVGDWVLAIGSPFGFDYSVSQGIVSAKGRSLPDGTYVPFIQTDVAVNPGNSGGPLFDLDGRVVGINAQIYSRSGGYQGLSFAIPINLAMGIVDQLKTDGSVSRGWLGVGIQDVTQALADSFGLPAPAGALVSQVMPNSPAAAAGFQPGDVIVKYNGRELNRSSELPPLVGLTPVGERADIEVLRDGRSLTLAPEIARLDDPRGQLKLSRADAADIKLGVAVADLSDAQREQFKVSHGVIINSVQPDSPAAKAGLRDGDLILSFNREDIKSVDDLAEKVRKASADKPSVLLVKREQGTLFVPLDLS